MSELSEEFQELLDKHCTGVVNDTISIKESIGGRYEGFDLDLSFSGGAREDLERIIRTIEPFDANVKLRDGKVMKCKHCYLKEVRYKEFEDGSGTIMMADLGCTLLDNIEEFEMISTVTKWHREVRGLLESRETIIRIQIK